MISKMTHNATYGLSNRPDTVSTSHRLPKGQNYSLIPQAGLYDFTIGYLYDRPLITGRKAFPRRLPTASSSKLKQMYMRTDTISGRLVHDTVQRNTEEKFARYLETQSRERIEKEMLELERQQQMEEQPVLRYTHLNKQRSVVPPITPRSYENGVTIISERTIPKTSYDTDCLPDDSRSSSMLRAPRSIKSHSARSSGRHAEMRIYLPKVDMETDEVSHNTITHNGTTPKVVIYTAEEEAEHDISSRRASSGSRPTTAKF